jgi:hypothetical protein
MSKVGQVYWHVTIALISTLTVYLYFSLVINTYVVVGWIAVTLVWVCLPLIIMQWYMWSNDG